MARTAKISPTLKKRAAQIKVLLMDVDGTMTDGGVILLSQPDGTALEIKQFDAHDGHASASPVDCCGLGLLCSELGGR